MIYCVSLTGKCFLYCNGLMDHIYVCQNGTSCTSWYKTPTHFSGTLVSVYECRSSFALDTKLIKMCQKCLFVS